MSRSGGCTDTSSEWTADDVQLYQLAIAAGRDPIDARELRLCVMDRLVVLPAFGVFGVSSEASPVLSDMPGLDFPVLSNGVLLHN